MRMQLDSYILLHLNNFWIMSEKIEIRKRMHDINTFFSTVDNETFLSGKDEWGNDFTITFDTIEILEWLNKKHMKKQAKIYIKNL